MGMLFHKEHEAFLVPAIHFVEVMTMLPQIPQSKRCVHSYARWGEAVTSAKHSERVRGAFHVIPYKFQANDPSPGSLRSPASPQRGEAKSHTTIFKTGKDIQAEEYKHSHLRNFKGLYGACFRLNFRPEPSA